MTVGDRLRELFPTAKQQTLKRMVQNGRVRVNGGRAVGLKQNLGDGDVLKVNAEKAGAKALAPPPFPVVYEDEDVLVIEKPAGLLTSTTPREKRATAVALVREYLAAREPKAKAALIHRLDRDAAGLLIFSKNNPAYESLKSQFFHHTVLRVYAAIVSPPPGRERGRIESNLVEHVDGSVHSARAGGKGQRAVTDYVVEKVDGGRALLRVTLQTGRKHQIRAHLSELGSPIVGDSVYGGEASAMGLKLRAIELAFAHPRGGKRMHFAIAARFDF
jgi:23S rRNA pseudouridine1911/1915/1917 synthase